MSEVLPRLPAAVVREKLRFSRLGLGEINVMLSVLPRLSQAVVSEKLRFSWLGKGNDFALAEN